MPDKNRESGFSYIEVIFAIMIMTIGILASLTAISAALLREGESGQKNIARQLTSSTLESIFATRDLRNENALSNWAAVANNTVATPDGIFLTGWRPIRRDSGIDGIEGTADDACNYGTYCQNGTYSNTSDVIPGFDRQILITDIIEDGVAEVRRKRVDVSVRYFAGQAQRTETVSTIIADLPFSQ